MCCCLSKPSPAEKAKQLLFNAAFEQFEADVKLKSMEPLNILRKAFVLNQKLAAPRDLYPIHEALVTVTTEVANGALDSIKTAWQGILQSLKTRKIYRIGLGYTAFDTRFAEMILAGKSDQYRDSMTFSTIDVQNKKNRQQVVAYLQKSDKEAFGALMHKGFFDNILKSKRVLCFAALDENREIVAILWGFSDESDKQKFFHAWEFSRNAALAKIGIATRLKAFALAQQQNYPEIKFATLNVDKSNTHAKDIYERESFKAQDTKEKAEKVFMEKSLSKDEAIKLQVDAKKVVKNFVLKSVPKCKLVWYELTRRIELLFRKCWYR